MVVYKHKRQSREMRTPKLADLEGLLKAKREKKRKEKLPTHIEDVKRI